MRITPCVAAAATLRETEPPEDLVQPLPSKKRGKATAVAATTPANTGNMKPGYYILDTKELKKTGVPKYIYVGDENSQPIPLGREESDAE